MTDRSADLNTWLDAIETDLDVESHDAAELRRIGEALIAVDRAGAELEASVAAAKASGRSWTEIANVLGVSRQAARQRFSQATATLE